MVTIIQRVLLITVALLWAAIPVSAQQQMSLQDAFEMALQNNHSIEIERIEREQAANNFFRGNAGLLPTLDIVGSAEFSLDDTNLEIADFSESPPTVDRISVDQSESRTYNAALQLNYTLFDGFRGRYIYRQLESQDRAAQISEQIAIENTLLDVAGAYLELLRRAESVQIREENLTLSEDRLERIKEDRRLGQASELQLLNAEVNYNADVIELSTAMTEREAAARDLLFLIGSDEMDEEIEPSDRIEVNDDLHPDEILSSALQQNAALMLAEEQTSQAELGRSITAADRYPRISLSSSYGYFRQEQDASNLPLLETRGITAGVTLRYNLFSGRQRSRAVQNADLDIRSSREQMRTVRNEVSKEVSNTYSRYENALQQLQLSELNVETADRNFENSREAFRQGQITSIELREAQINLLNENLRLNDLRYRAKQTELVLMVLSGTFLNGEM